MYKILKRVFDLIIAVMLLPIFFVLYLVIGVGIKLEDHGPVLYCGKRLGKDKKAFRMYKFRSMKVNAPDIRNEDGSTYNAEDDKRVTRIGRVIRKTSLDEVPQILNILLGQMSFVGPRPDCVTDLSLFQEEYETVLSVRPGITGYNQATNRNLGGSKDKIENDIYYVNHMSFLFDCKIILLTIKTVLTHKNLYRNEKKKKESAYEKNNGIGC